MNYLFCLMYHAYFLLILNTRVPSAYNTSPCPTLQPFNHFVLLYTREVQCKLQFLTGGFPFHHMGHTFV